MLLKKGTHGTGAFEAANTGINKLLIKIAAHSMQVLLLCEDNTVYSQGGAETGLLGLGPVDTWDVSLYCRGDEHEITFSKPQLVSALNSIKIIDIAAGGHVSLFLADNGTLYTCGAGYAKLLSEDGIEDQYFTPTPIPRETFDNQDVIKIAAGYGQALALTRMCSHKTNSLGSNQLYGYGSNYHNGLLQDEDVEDLFEFTKLNIPNVGRVVEISAGMQHFLILNAAGQVYGGGSNAYYQLSVPDASPFCTLRLLELPPIKTLYAGPYYSVFVPFTGHPINAGQPNWRDLDVDLIEEPCKVEVMKTFPEDVVAVHGITHTVAVTASNKAYSFVRELNGLVEFELPAEARGLKPILASNYEHIYVLFVDERSSVLGDRLLQIFEQNQMVDLLIIMNN
jgi:hypothetical protein